MRGVVAVVVVLMVAACGDEPSGVALAPGEETWTVCDAPPRLYDDAAVEEWASEGCQDVRPDLIALETARVTSFAPLANVRAAGALYIGYTLADNLNELDGLQVVTDLVAIDQNIHLDRCAVVAWSRDLRARDARNTYTLMIDGVVVDDAAPCQP